jgi:hypothetical protein
MFRAGYFQQTNTRAARGDFSFPDLQVLLTDAKHAARIKIFVMK